jgi:hypothetical protein
MVRWPPVEVKVEDALALKFTNFKRRFDLCSGNNWVQVLTHSYDIPYLSNRLLPNLEQFAFNP